MLDCRLVPTPLLSRVVLVLTDLPRLFCLLPQLAFRAFTKELETNKINRLPSTPWSPQQLFFLGFAQAWCSNTQEEKALAILRSDTHSLPRFRVNGVVSNSADFADAFKCKARSPMNPEEKCNLWN